MTEGKDSLMTKTFEVEVTQTVRVTLDETKFDETFMQEFRDSFFSFDELEEHVGHIAQLHARGVVDLEGRCPTDFVEGYGPANEMGIKAETIDTDVYVIGATS